MKKGWDLFMRNNKVSKFYSLVLSSMIFSTSALSPVYASKCHIKKRVFSDTYSLSERVKSESKAMESREKRETDSGFSGLSKNPICQQVNIVAPVPINKYEICEKVKNLEEEIYKSELFRIVKVAKNVFDIDICTDISFRGRKGYYDLKFFKNRVRKLYGKQWDDDKLVPLNVVVYFYTMYILQNLNNKIRENKMYHLKLWKEHKMTEEIISLNKKRTNLDNLIHTSNTNLIFQFHCYIEDIIDSLFRVRNFYEVLEVEGGPSYVKDVDTAIAMLCYIEKTIIR